LPTALALRVWLSIHRWLGLALLLVFLAFAITGCALVWPVGFERLIHSERFPPTPADAAQFASFESMRRTAEAVLPALAAGPDRPSALRLVAPGGPVLVAGQIRGPANHGLGPAQRAKVWLDPATGEVLAVHDGTADGMWWMRAIHGHLLLATAGREVVAFGGLLLVISAVSGLWLWWPGWRHLGAALRWRTRFGTAMNLHRIGGALIVVVLIVEGVTGAYVAIPGVFAQIVEPGARTARSAEGPPPSTTRAATQLSVEAVLALARPRVSAATLNSVFLPTERSAMWAVNFETSAGERSVLVDDLTGSTTVRKPAAPSRADRVESVMIDTHFGHYGAVWQMIVFLSGVFLTLLAVTGPWLWWQARQRRARVAR
jgi:uncharacterized iron-regulated membrane protein